MVPTSERKSGAEQTGQRTCGQIAHGNPTAAERRSDALTNARNIVSRLRVLSFAISIDGYGAGPNQDPQNPLGLRGPELMEWFFPTRLWRRMHGHDDGETGVDHGIAEQGFANIGAWILGRNMFGPSAVRGRMTAGKAGGATNRRITRRFSC